MEKRTYLQNAALLTGTGIALRAAGIVFRVLVAGRLGSEGMGLHQLVLGIYNVSIALATSGVSVAATRLTAGAAGEREGQKAMAQVLRVGFFLGLAAAALQCLLAGPAATRLLGDARAAPSLRILAPSLPFMAVAAAVRGYFLARRNVRPNARAQLAEQALRIGLVWLLLERFEGRDIGVLCGCVVLGNTLSEALSCLLMLAFYRRERGEKTSAGRVPGLYREIWRIVLPLEGSRGLSGALHAAENTLVPACLTLYLHNRVRAISQFGALRGMALPLVFFPFSFLAALSALLLPDITEAYAQKRTWALNRLISNMMTLTGGVSVLAGGLCTLYGGVVGQMLYGDPEVGRYLSMLGPMLPLMYLESMVDGVLKGMGEQLATFRYSVLDSALRIGGILFLLPRWGIYGFLGLMLGSNFLTCLLNTLRMLRTAGISADWGNWLLKPTVLMMLALAAGRLLQTALPMDGLPGLAAGAVGTIGCYGLLWWRPAAKQLMRGKAG